MWVPVSTLRYIERPGGMNDEQVIQRYRNGELEIHVWQDCVVQGHRVVTALMRHPMFRFGDVRVHVRERLPIHEYPGDV